MNPSRKDVTKKGPISTVFNTLIWELRRDQPVESLLHLGVKSELRTKVGTEVLAIVPVQTY